ncbi:MAG: deoxyribose-phosphate aldolase [Planctomycetes bacterium]|nr:deoxyribose-phosphate aldolase [Planctomycetota bacterium]
MPAREAAHELTVETVARTIDHVVLAPDHTFRDVEQACAEATDYGFASVCLAPYAVGFAARLLRGTGVAICGAVGIPLGYSGMAAKCDEARTSIEAGAGEIEMAINLVAMKSGRYADVQGEIAAVRRLATGLVLKVTLECCYLTDAEKARACKLAIDAGADFVKTSTGFGRAGATVRDVHLLGLVTAGRAEIEAAGGITRFRQVQDMMRAGAARIASPDAVKIIKDFYRWEAE